MGTRSYVDIGAVQRGSGGSGANRSYVDIGAAQRQVTSGGTTLTLVTPGALTLAAAPGLAVQVSGPIGTPGALVLAAASGLAVAVDHVISIATAGVLQLVIASGVTGTGVAAADGFSWAMVQSLTRALVRGMTDTPKD